MSTYFLSWENSTIEDILQLMPKNRLVYFGLYVPLLVVIIIGNGLVIVIFIRERDVRTTTNSFLTSMAVCDFLFAFGFAFWTSKLFPHQLLFNKFYCLLNWMLAFPVEQLSMWHVLVVGVDRVIAFSFPYRHPMIVSSRNINLIIGLMWLVCLVEHLFPTLAWNRWTAISNCYTEILSPLFLKAISFVRLILIIAIVIANCILLWTLIKIAKRVESDEMMMRRIAHRNEIQDIWSPQSDPRHHIIQKRVTHFVFTVITVFLVCQLPKVILLFIISVRPFGKIHDTLYIINFGGLINAAINPWIYALRDTTFNRGCKKLLFRIKASRQTDGVRNF